MKHDSIIVYEGLPFISVFGVLTVLSMFFLNQAWLSSFFLFATVFTTWFFRNPARNTPEDPGLVISPADGQVIKIDNDFQHELLSKPCIKVSIFMNVFNVHVNRAPCSGTVTLIRYFPGCFFCANLDKASEQNERNALLFRTEDGKDILTIQIAGLIAKRIVCWVSEGSFLKKGERFGMIRFGSRLEVFMPKEARTMVTVGDKVRAGETPLGTF